MKYAEFVLIKNHGRSQVPGMKNVHVKVMGAADKTNFMVPDLAEYQNQPTNDIKFQLPDWTPDGEGHR